MHKIYDDVFKNTTVDDVKLIVGNRNRRSARYNLIRKRPKQSLLRNIPMKSMCDITYKLSYSFIYTTLLIFFFFPSLYRTTTKKNKKKEENKRIK
jgi:hypothetical protein